jgi:hypothetical protein
MSILLKGFALRWHQTNMYQPWERFRFEFLKTFSSDLTDDELEEKIKNRLQGDDEPFLKCLDSMIVLFDSLFQEMHMLEK